MLNVNQMYPSSFSLYIKVIGMGRTTDFCVIGKKEDFTWYLAAGREQDAVGNEKNSEGSKNTEHFWKVWTYDETDRKHTCSPLPRRRILYPVKVFPCSYKPLPGRLAPLLYYFLDILEPILNNLRLWNMFPLKREAIPDKIEKSPTLPGWPWWC